MAKAHTSSYKPKNVQAQPVTAKIDISANHPPAVPLSRLRAQHALAAAQGLIPTRNQIDNYVSHVEGLPARILRNGLGQAMAMERMKSPTDLGHKLLYEQMERWLIDGWPTSPLKAKPDELGRASVRPEARLLIAIVKSDQDTYIRAQAEALAYLEWLKKFAVAFLKNKAAVGLQPNATEEPAGAGP